MGHPERQTVQGRCPARFGVFSSRQVLTDNPNINVLSACMQMEFGAVIRFPIGKNLSIPRCEVIKNAPLKLVCIAVKNADIGEQLNSLGRFKCACIGFNGVLHLIVAFKFCKAFPDIPSLIGNKIRSDLIVCFCFNNLELPVYIFQNNRMPARIGNQIMAFDPSGKINIVLFQ